VGFVTRFVAHRDFTESSDWANPQSIPDHALRHFRDDELSLYWLPNLRSLSRVVAAFALRHPQKLKPQGVLVVDEIHISAAGFTLKCCAGDVPDLEVRDWHREVHGLDEGDARRLAFAFVRNGACHHFTIASVRMCVNDNFAHCAAANLSVGVGADLRKLGIDV
jgi:hypothetical protein